MLSDLHLGGRSGTDLLRGPGAARDALLAAIPRGGRVVLAGDVLELRHGPAREALAAARDMLAALGAAVGADGEVVLLAGNHDHRIVGGWLERTELRGPGPMPAASTFTPAEASPLAEAVGAALGPARVRFAYPGLWLVEPPDGDRARPGGTYVTHGHHQDVVWPTPTLERLATGLVGRALRSPPHEARDFDALERLMAAPYAFQHETAEHEWTGGASAGQQTSARTWEALQEPGPRGAAMRIAVPLGVRAVQALGVGPLETRLTPTTLRRGGTRGLARLLHQVGVRPAHVVCGHTHRKGPQPGDAAWEWRLADGGSIVNVGSWVAELGALGGDDQGGPYWPGAIAEVDDDGVPRLRRLLDDVGAAELRGDRG